MLFKSISLVLGLVVVLAAVSQANEVLDRLCQYLDGKLEVASGEVAYNIAIKHINSPWMFLSKWPHLLGQAWEAVYKRQPCDQNFPKYIVAIDDCLSHHNQNVRRNLFKQTREYVANCSNGSVWTAALDDALKSMKKADREAVSDFLDEDFLRKYYEDNKELHRDDLRNREYLLLSSTAGRPALDALIAHHESKKKEMPVVEQYMRNPKLLQKDLDRLIIAPCASYAKAMKTLNRALKATTESRGFRNELKKPYSMQMEEYLEFMKSFPKEFKDAIFRYKFCMDSMSSPKILANAIADVIRKLDRPSE